MSCRACARARSSRPSRLSKLGIELTPAVIDKIKWEAFWDAPLYIEGSGELPPTHKTAIPGVKRRGEIKPGLPRIDEEVRRGWRCARQGGCDVRDHGGGRLEVSFPGVTLGVFEGTPAVRFSSKGRIGSSSGDCPNGSAQSVAYKYRRWPQGCRFRRRPRSSGAIRRPLAGSAVRRPGQRIPVVWSRQPPYRRRPRRRVDRGVPAAAQFLRRARIESGTRRQLYRKDSDTHSRSGSGRPKGRGLRNSSITSRSPARGPATGADAGVLLRQPRTAPAARGGGAHLHSRRSFKPLPGYQVMGSHYHVGMVPRLKESGSLDNRFNDVESMKAVGHQHLWHHRRRPRATRGRGVPGSARPSTTTPPGGSPTRRSW